MIFLRVIDRDRITAQPIRGLTQREGVLLIWVAMTVQVVGK